MKISDIDSNFKVCEVNRETYQMVDVSSLILEGFAWEHENKHPFYRLPERIFPKIDEGLCLLGSHSAGGVLRFCTDSKALLLKGHFRPVSPMPHMPLSGQAGFDVTVRKNGYDCLLVNLPPCHEKLQKEEFDFAYPCHLKEGMYEYRVYFPLYAGIEDMQIGFSEGARIEPAPPHKIEKPILFYGSSITQGACASRPSSCYTAMLANWVDAAHINLGFSGHARGETIMAETISELDLSCMVMDYDFNAPTVEHLKETHEPFFQIIRKNHPDLPVIFISRPSLGASYTVENREMRRAVIMETYTHAKAQGDTNVYFVDGMRFFEDAPHAEPTVDRCHPTDLGFYLMAKGILPTLERALGLA